MRSEYIVCDNCGSITEHLFINMTLKKQNIYEGADAIIEMGNSSFTELAEYELCQKCAEAIDDALNKRREDMIKLIDSTDYLDGHKYKEDNGEEDENKTKY